MNSVTVERVVCVLLSSDRDPFDSLLVVTLLGVLKEPVDPVQWLICVVASPVMSCY